MKANKLEDIWNWINIQAVENCWEWKRFISKDGYARFKHLGKSYLVHRIVFLLYYGLLPKCVCHYCDNRKCCNPYHLWAGTYQLNRQDCVNKNRHVDNSGENHGQAKLTAENVLDIRNSHLTRTELIKKYNVSRSLIRKIQIKECWKII